MKQSLSIIFLICVMLCSCEEVEKEIKSMETQDESSERDTGLFSIDVEPYYFPFKEKPTIYEYSESTEKIDGTSVASKSYMEFGIENDTAGLYFIYSYDDTKTLLDKVILKKQSDGYYFSAYSFLNEQKERTVVENPTGLVYPFERFMGDQNTVKLNYSTPMSGETAFVNVSSSFSFEGFVETPSSSSDELDCIKFDSTIKAILNTLETKQHAEFEEKEVILDKLNHGVYQSIVTKFDGSVTSKVFSRIVPRDEWIKDK